MQGIIFDIQRFSLHDGPGIRTTVFLKGCMMRCQWCHNPESFQIQPQLGYHAQKCIGCGQCAAVCPQGVHTLADGAHKVRFDACAACGACVQACDAEALEIYGRAAEDTDVIDEVMKDTVYYDASGGGVTFSGGEPTMQPDFLLSLLRLAKEGGLHICLETNGVIQPDLLQKLLAYVDLWLFDYKATGTALHKRLTGADDTLPLASLNRLSQAGQPVILRCPMIPGVNDTAAHLAEIRRLTQVYPNIQKAEPMPYHNFGTDKWRRIGMHPPIDLPNATSAQRAGWEAALSGD